MAGDGRKRYKTAEAKFEFLKLLAEGYTRDDALAVVQRTANTYRDWREKDPHFADEVDGVRDGRRRRGVLPDFPTFCRQYLGQPLYWHQLQWVDVLEGRKPRDLHESQVYEPGDPQMVLVNTPPEHGKTSTLSINYATWRVVKDPNIKIMFISKTQEMAKQILWGVKNRLTHPNYARMQAEFGPQGGWKADADKWAADMIYLGQDRDTKDKDPTIHALGIGGHVYGARVDLAFLDDCVVLSNAHEYEKQVRWLQQEVITRGNPSSVYLVIGTRVDATDLYSELRNPDRYPDGVSPWTYLAQPAVLEYQEDPKNWVTLWPRADVAWPGAMEKPDPDGLYSRWDGKHLRKRRSVLAPRTWALTYQQETITEDAIFPVQVVRSCVSGMRQPGVMSAGAPGHRPAGMDGLYIIGSMDPAMVGNTGVIIMGVDRMARKRYVLQILNQARATPRWIRDTIKDLTETYTIHEWRIEKNGFQSYLTQDPELHEWLAALGVRIHEHHTGKNKWDVDFGVASMAPAFEHSMIELPATHLVESSKQLVEQLTTWHPETKGKTDLVMALWFAEVRAREIINANTLGKGQTNFVKNKWATKRAKGNQVVVNLNDLAIAARS